MKRLSLYVLIFIFSLGISIAYSNLTHAEEKGKVIDRVCTMQIDKASAATLTKDGYTYYFCSNNCKTSFAKVALQWSEQK